MRAYKKWTQNTFLFQRYSANSPRKFSVLSSPGNYYSWDYKGICSGTLDVYSRKQLLRIVLQRCFCYWRKRHFWYVFVNNFHFQRSGLCLFPCEILVAFFLIGCTAFGNTSILCGILNICSKTKTKSAGQKKCSYKNHRKELQNFVCYLGNQSFGHQLVQELHKTSRTKVYISLGEKNQ